MATPQEMANAIRFLAADAVQAANSGHPGMPLGMADIATTLWHKHMKHNPNNPSWWDRDRFILSNGHGAMLHYALLHLTGYDLSLDDLKQFRQLHSKTPGHPEHGETPGIETTTGPLGQGLANAVGMAIVERHLAAKFNQDNLSLIDHYTYVFAGDGCMMEGVSHEACSMAGHLGLGKLVVFYDDNGISIDGKLDGWFADDTASRFHAYGWHVIPKVDGHDPVSIEAAILEAKAETKRPSLVICQTVIGKGAPNASGGAKCHGSPLGLEEIDAMRQALSWPYPAFEVPDSIREAWDARGLGQKRENDWQERWNEYRVSYPELAAELSRVMGGDLPADWLSRCESMHQMMAEHQKPTATRKSSLACLNHLAPILPELIGGSADLTPSNLTAWKDVKVLDADHPEGQYVHYGVREFGMAAIMNGMALHRGVIPFGGTFLTFLDYMRNAVRLSALMRQRVVYVFTHDSIGLGEDGPTHQPIEHINMCRLTPNLHNWRPADACETAVAWQMALERQTGPTTLLLSRQDVPALPTHSLDDIKRGAYVLMADQDPDCLLIATGSEVSIALDAAKQLQGQGVAVHVVSMPCVECFDAQDLDYQHHVLPTRVTCRVAIEAGSTAYWHRFVGPQGSVLGIDSFGASAPASDLYQHFGLTVERLVETVQQQLSRQAQTT